MNSRLKELSRLCGSGALLPALLACGLLFTGCAKEETPGGLPDGPSGGGGTAVTLRLSGVGGALHAAGEGASKSASTPATRGVLNPSSTDEGAVVDMWVLQYDMSVGEHGSLAARRYVSSVAQDGSDVYVRAELEPMERARIVVLANAPGSFSESDLPVGSTLTDLAAKTFAVDATSGGALPRENSTVLPMRGESEGELKLEAGKLTMVHVPLYRLVAKVNFTVDNLCTAGYPNLTLTGITLRNVPAVGSYARLTEATHREVRYPAVARANFKDYDAQTEGLGAGCQLLWYLTPNSRGVGSGTTSLEKTMLSAPEGQGGCCTYVYVQGQIRTAADATPIPVGYRVYLGGNSTNDYNVWANESYNVRLTIRKLPSNPAADIGRDGFTVDMAAVEGFDHTVDWVRPMSVGDLYGAGVVYWVNPDDANDFRIVAMDEVSALHWASSTGYVLGSGAQNSSARNGAEVWRLAKAYSDAKTGGATGDFATDFPAFAACYDKTEGGVPKGTWYLPSLQETTDLNAVKAAVGEVIATYGGMALAEGERWTATESSSNKSQGSRYNFSGSGNSGSGNKNTDGIVRCVRGPR